MTWAAGAVLGGVLVLALAVAYLLRRAGQRAAAAEEQVAIERSKTLDAQARDARARHGARVRQLSDDEIVTEANAIAERIRRDMDRRKP